MWRALLALSCLIAFPAPSPAQGRPFERASAAFIQRYLQEWSGPATAALAYMDQVYPNQVDFYGQALTHAALMDRKRRFAARWPERALSVRPGSIQVVCDPTHLCTVRALFDWRYRSPQRQAASSGSASLKLELQDGMTILAEDGAVIPPGTGTLPPLVPRAPIALAAARPASPPNVPAAPVAEAKPQQGEPRPQRDDVRTAAVASGSTIPPVGDTPPPAAQLASIRPTAAQSAPAPDEPSPPVADVNRRRDGPGPGPDGSNPQRDEIAALRSAYHAHAADKDWIAAWLAQKRDFSGQATFVGATEDRAGPGPNDVLRTDGFISAAGTIACINPEDASLKVGEKVNVHGVITIFIEDVMYLGQCSIRPG